MRTHMIFCVCILTLNFNLLLGQNTKLRIKKTQGNYTKEIKLPVKLRLVKHNDAVVKLNLDSIVYDKFYGNKGNDSLLANDIAVVHLGGIKEIAKYAAFATCVAATIGATIFTYSAFNKTAFKCDLDNAAGCDYNAYKIAGIAYTTGFAGLGTLLYILPKTRFSTKMFTFTTQ